MKLTFPVLVACSLACAACVPMPREEALKQELAEANYCDVPADCELIGSKCPFDCYIYVNKEKAVEMLERVNAFQSQCEYSCVQSFGVECTNRKCVAKTEPNPEGNVGAACKSDGECATPMRYLTRSSCLYGSQCVEGTCAVTCQITPPDPALDGLPPECSVDSDCDCKNFVPNDSKDCRCLSGKCAAVVER
jgi:hypothetical protein